MPFLVLTRFSSKTWEENQAYRKKHKYPGCIYGSPRLLAKDIKPKAHGFVLEINITTRQIMGVGFVLNLLYPKPCWIYSAGEYNAYVYNSLWRLDRSHLEAEARPLLWVLEQIIFKHRVCLMRGHGLSRIPTYVGSHPTLRVADRLSALFRHVFPRAPPALWPHKPCTEDVSMSPGRERSKRGARRLPRLAVVKTCPK